MGRNKNKKENKQTLVNQVCVILIGSCLSGRHVNLRSHGTIKKFSLTSLFKAWTSCFLQRTTIGTINYPKVEGVCLPS